MECRQFVSCMQNGTEAATAAGQYVVMDSRPENQPVTGLRCYCAQFLYVYAIPIIYLMFIKVMQQQISICACYSVILITMSMALQVLPLCTRLVLLPWVYF